MSDKAPLFKYLDQKKNDKLKILEIGVAQCDTGVQILQRYPNFHYTGIDKWEYDVTLKHEANKIANWNSQEKWDGIYQQVLDKTKEFGDRCQIIRKCSREFLPTFEERFDFIHIDGDHSEEGAYQDIIMCKDLLKTGGRIWMDDINLKDIKKAINRFFWEYNNEYDLIGSAMIIKL